MSINVDSVQTFTDAQLLVLYRKALADLSFSQTVSINGRTVNRAQIPQIQNMIEWLESRIQTAANSSEGGNIAYATFQTPT